MNKRNFCQFEPHDKVLLKKIEKTTQTDFVFDWCKNYPRAENSVADYIDNHYNEFWHIIASSFASELVDCCNFAKWITLKLKETKDNENFAIILLQLVFARFQNTMDIEFLIEDFFYNYCSPSNKSDLKLKRINLLILHIALQQNSICISEKRDKRIKTM